MRRGNLFVVGAAVLCAALPALGVQSFMDLGAGTAAPSISKDGTLVGGADGTGGFIAVNGVKTYTPGATPKDVEYIGATPTAIGKTTSAAIWQGSSWTTLPLAGGTTTWTPTGIGVTDSSTWYASGYTGDTSGRTPIKYSSVAGTSVNIGVPSGGSDGRATAIADNGAIGATADNSGSPRNAFYGLPVSWLYCNTSPGIGSSVESEVFDISSDGSTKIGWGYTASGAWQAYYWKPGGTANLIPLYLGVDWAEGHAVDGDGTVFGGFSWVNGYSTMEAWIWQVGWSVPKSVAQYLNEQGVDTTGWTFTNVTGIDFDGTSFVGTGTFGGVDHTWAFSVVPEPSALVLLALGAVAVIRRR